MSLIIRLRRAAKTEYDEAIDWYGHQRSGLGVRFALAVDEMFSTIAAQPDRFPKVWPDTREAHLSDWPYCVYYQVHEDHVMIIAVFHSSRNPEIWQKRA